MPSRASAAARKLQGAPIAQDPTTRLQWLLCSEQTQQALADRICVMRQTVNAMEEVFEFSEPEP